MVVMIQAAMGFGFRMVGLQPTSGLSTIKKRRMKSHATGTGAAFDLFGRTVTFATTSLMFIHIFVRLTNGVVFSAADTQKI